MLILGRKTGQSIMIGDGIKVTIVGVEGERVKLGVQAPDNVLILRQELVDAVRQENMRAAGGGRSKDEVLSSLRRLIAGRPAQEGEEPASSPTP